MTVADYARKMFGMSRKGWEAIPCDSPCGDHCCRAIASAAALNESIIRAHGRTGEAMETIYDIVGIAANLIDTFIHG